MMPISTGQGSAPSQQIAQFRSDGVTAATGLRIPFFSDDFARGNGIPEARLINMISEATPLREERPYVPLVGLRDIRLSRPGLTTGLNLGAGPIRGLIASPATFGGGHDYTIVSGTTAYNEAGTVLGTIPGTDRVRGAISASQIVIVANGQAFCLPNPNGSGNTYGPIANPVLPPVSDIAWLAQRFVYPALGTARFYYSEINDAANEQGLDFATVETSPDPIVGVSVLNDELVFFKTRSTEFWNVSSDANNPFQPVEGRGYQRGALSRDSIVYLDNALFFVGDDGIVYRSEGVPTAISNHAIESKIRQCVAPSTISAFGVIFEGHPFYILNIPNIGSYGYDVSRVGTEMGAYGNSFERGEWVEWQSYAQPTFRGNCSLLLNANQNLVGDNATNDVWNLTTGAYTDAGGPMVRQASAFAKIEEGNPRCTGIALQCVEGVGNSSGAGVNPTVEMRFSDDLGRTFSRWMGATLGQTGRYGPPRAYWSRLGIMRAPGRLFEVRCADPVNFVVSHLELNPVRIAW